MKRWLTAAAVAVLLLTALGYLGEHAWVAELASSLRVQWLVLAVVVGGLAAIGRAWLALGLAVATVAANVTVLAPFHRGGDPAPTDPRRLVVAHVNLQHRDLDDDGLRKVLRERRPDLVFVLEPEIGWAAGRTTFAGYRVVTDGSPKVSAVALARVAPRHAGRPLVDGLPGGALALETTFAGSPLWILAFHAQAPVTPHLLGKRDRSLRVGARLAASHSGQRLVLGDFNTTPWSYALERFADGSGLLDSTEGHGIQSSWPWFLGPFGVAIDQLFHSPDLVVVERETGPGLGSTHRSLWVTLAPAPD